MKNKIDLKNKKLYISHGETTHLIGKECKDCEESLKEFEQALESGEVQREIINPSIIKQR